MVNSIYLQTIFCLILISGVKLDNCPNDCKCNDISMNCHVIPTNLLMMSYHTSVIITNMTDPIMTLNKIIISPLSQMLSLELCNVGLQVIQTETFSSMNFLTNLTIKQNDISVLESGTFTNCTHLTNLHFSKNQLKEIRDNVFIDLTRLETIDLSGNLLSSIPENLPSLLKHLNVANNIITTISSLQYPSLQSLNICQNHITTINPLMVVLPKLQTLCLGGPNYTIEDELLSPMNMPSLTSLELNGEDERRPLVISVIAGNDIYHLINSTLTSLKLKYCSLQSNNIFPADNKLIEFTATNTTLAVIGTRIYHPSDVDTHKLTIPSIYVLIISGSPILATLFIRSLTTQGSFPELQTLKMSRCSIETIPSSILKKAPNLKNLDISYNPLHCNCSQINWLIQDNINLLDSTNTLCSSPLSMNKQELVKIKCTNSNRAFNTYPQELYSKSRSNTLYEINYKTVLFFTILVLVKY